MSTLPMSSMEHCLQTHLALKLYFRVHACDEAGIVSSKLRATQETVNLPPSASARTHLGFT